MLAPAPALLVDDDHFVRRSMRRSLAGLGLEAVDAASGEEALQLLARRDFALAFIDLRMPGIGGHATIRRAAELFPRVPLIGMSGNGDMNDVIECLRDGAVDFLVKPWTASELGEVVRRTMQKRVQRVRDETAKEQAPTNAAAATPAAPPPADAQPPQPSLSFVLARMRRGEITLPAQPMAALLVRRLLTRLDASATQLKDVIERDQHLTGRVLRVANSAQYTGYGRVNDVRTALTRIGNREIGVVVETIIARRFFEVTIPEARVHVEGYWRRSWARAVAMRLLARTTPGYEAWADFAYLAGLFCDAGAAFLVRVLSAELGCELREGELSAIAENHGAVSASITTAWDMPIEVSHTCKHHHQGGPAAGRTPLLRLLAAAELVCKGLDLPPDPARLDVPDDLLQVMQLTPERLPDLASQVADVLQTGAEAIED